MFWHTGGIFGMYEYEDILKQVIKGDWEKL